MNYEASQKYNHRTYLDLKVKIINMEEGPYYKL